jgi:DNA-directed RNA polymerase subunit RPC12/RpoP
MTPYHIWKIIAQGAIGALCGTMVPCCLSAIPGKMLVVFGVPKDYMAFISLGLGCAGGVSYSIYCIRKEMKDELKAQRRADGLCTECGYDLRGVPSERCPECGSLILFAHKMPTPKGQQ